MSKKKLKTIGLILNILGMGCNLAASTLDAQVMSIEMSEMVEAQVAEKTEDLRLKLLRQMANNKH